VILPACTAAEKVGTFTNHEGDYCPVVRALEPKGESRPDWEILEEIASKIHPEHFYAGVEEIQQEIGRLVEGFPTAALPRRLEGIPTVTAAHLATVAQRYRRPSSPTAQQEVLTLQLIPILYHSGKLSLQAEGLTTIYPKGRLAISPQDGEQVGAATGAVVRLAPAGASQPAVEVEVEVQTSLPAGLCLFPEHFNNPPVKELVTASVDATSGVPYMKRGAVTMRLLRPAPPEASPGASS